MLANGIFKKQGGVMFIFILYGVLIIAITFIHISFERTIGKLALFRTRLLASFKF